MFQRTRSLDSFLFFFAMAVFLPSIKATAADSVWKTTTVHLEAVVNKKAQFDLRNYLHQNYSSNPSTGLSYESKKLPEGFSLVEVKTATLDTMILAGTPKTVGKIPVFYVTATNPDGEPFKLGIDINVVAVATALPAAGENPPRFSERPVNLPGVTAGEAYSTSIAGYVAPPTGTNRTFARVSGAKWLDVKPDGSVVAKDGKAPLDMAGANVVRVKVTDSGGTDEVNAYVEVAAANEPPRWEFKGESLTYIDLQVAEQGKEMSDDLSRFAVDNQLLNFGFVKKANVPSWFSMRTDGTVNSDVPLDAALKDYQVLIWVTDGAPYDPAKGNTDRVAFILAKGKVSPPNHAPKFADPVNVTVKERTSKRVLLTGGTEPLVTDEDAGDTLTFELNAEKPKWLELSPSGELFLNPEHEQLAGSPYEFKFTVTDGKTPVSGTLQISVLKDPLPPAWVKPLPYDYTLTAGEQFDQSLKGFAEDREGLDVTYSYRITSGSNWFVIEEGPREPKLKGRPDKDDVGTVKGFLTAKNSFKSAAERPFTITVLPGNKAPVWKTDAAGKITLKAAVPDQRYSAFLYDAKDKTKSLVTDSDEGDQAKLKIDFSYVDKNNTWAVVNRDTGEVFGWPDLTQNTSPIELDVIATDRAGAASEKARIRIPFKAANVGPKWDFPNTEVKDLENVPLVGGRQFDLNDYSSDEDDPDSALQYKIKVGPSWAQIVGQSQLVLNPPPGTAVKAYTLVITLTDGPTDPDLATGGFKFVLVNGGGGGGGGQNVAPEFVSQPTFDRQAGVALEERLNVPSIVKDANVGDTLTFSWSSISQLPPWLALSPEGILTIGADSVAGTYERGIKVTDGKLTTAGLLTLNLTTGGGGGGTIRPPIWIKGNIGSDEGSVKLRPGEQLAIGLPTEEATNRPNSPAGLGLYFGKSNCPQTWITVTREGALKIAPLTSTAPNDYTCEIIASNDPAYGTQGRPFNRDRDSVGVLRVTVTAPVVSNGTWTGELGVKPASGTIPAEILFVLDNETNWDGISYRQLYFDQFKLAGQDFMSKLDAKGVDYRIAFVSARDLKGNLRAPSGSPLIIKSNTFDRNLEFQRHVDCTKSSSSDVSPTLAMGAFNEKLDSYTSISGKEFGVSGAPLFVYVLSYKPDQFNTLFPKLYGPDEQIPTGKSAAKMLFKGLSVKRQKPVIVYYENHNCVNTGSTTGPMDQFYKAFTGYNYGQFLVPRDCSRDSTPWLSDFADEVAAQSYRFRRRSVNFENQTYNVGNMRVFIDQGNSNSIELVGNTGDDSTDQWSFGNSKAGKPTLWIHWWNIYTPFNPKTDKLVIRY